MAGKSTRNKIQRCRLCVTEKQINYFTTRRQVARKKGWHDIQTKKCISQRTLTTRKKERKTLIPYLNGTNKRRRIKEKLLKYVKFLKTELAQGVTEKDMCILWNNHIIWFTNLVNLLYSSRCLDPQTAYYDQDGESFPLGGTDSRPSTGDRLSSSYELLEDRDETGDNLALSFPHLLR